VSSYDVLYVCGADCRRMMERQQAQKDQETAVGV